MQPGSSEITPALGALECVVLSGVLDRPPWSQGLLPNRQPQCRIPSKGVSPSPGLLRSRQAIRNQAMRTSCWTPAEAAGDPGVVTVWAGPFSLILRCPAKPGLEGCKPHLSALRGSAAPRSSEPAPAKAGGEDDSLERGA